jgi:hypothetical protein
LIAQRAFPVASEVRIYQLEAPERILSHWKLPVPATVNSSVSPVEMPIPIFPLSKMDEVTRDEPFHLER